MKNDELFFPQAIYLNHLTILNGIYFTPREIDVIACLLHARGTSKIASLLNIAPTTVITHIQNIKEKLKCNSRESIIDFTERSHSLAIIRKYYASLLVHTTFEKCLKACSKLISNPLSSLIVYCKDQQVQSVFAYYLRAHLKLAGIEAEVQLQQLHYKREDIKNQTSTHIVILEKERDCSQTLRDDAFVDFRNQRHYCFSVFEILKKLCPKVDFEPIVFEFKKVYETMKGLDQASYISALNNYLNLQQKDFQSIEDKYYGRKKYRKNRLKSFFLLEKRRLYLIGILFVIGLIGSSFLKFCGD